MPDAEIVARDGKTQWILIPLADGRWAATTNAEPTGQTMPIFPTRLAALAYQWQKWLDRYPRYHPEHDDNERFGWVAVPEWLSTNAVAARYGLQNPSTIRVAILRHRIHPAGLWKANGKAWLIRAEEAERLWGHQ